MKRDDTLMYDDPATPAHVRELISAGRRASTGYDVERGLARHLAAIGASAPAANWAPAAAAAKSSLPAWFGFLAMPLAAATVAGALWFYASGRSAAPAPASRAVTAAPAPSEVPGVRAGEPAEGRASEAQLPETAEQKEVDQRPAPERRRIGSRAHGSRYGRASNGARGTSEPVDLNAVNGIAAGGGEGTPSEIEADDIDTASGPARTSSESTRRVVSKPESNAAAEREPVAETRTAAAKVAPDAPQPAKAAAPVVDESRLEREMQMLAVTQRVLGSDPGRALRLSEQGEREFSGSMFSAERRQLRLLALVKLGRLDEARREGRRFLARYPKAPWSERLRHALATGVVE